MSNQSLRLAGGPGVRMSKHIEKDGRSVKRLRPEQIEAVIISTVFDELLENGFRAVTIESISAKTGIAKTSIYRRWPNKAAMVMEAFLFRIGPGIGFPSKSRYVESIRLQMLALAQALDALYGWLYYRLMIGSGPISDACVRGIFSAVLDGLRVRED